MCIITQFNMSITSETHIVRTVHLGRIITACSLSLKLIDKKWSCLCSFFLLLVLSTVQYPLLPSVKHSFQHNWHKTVPSSHSSSLLFSFFQYYTWRHLQLGKQWWHQKTAAKIVRFLNKN